ncbi:cytidine(C)-cytidine(C)-adenosine (A)]-adding enzyme [Geotalea uraniireducens]|uniref:Cytidine(C)-cytidine(C)-adenosine (A)]-adding enzyme n=1 Tax=Geotalea uraniireducens TaxID=351604 RepID=A0ABM8EK79_9BACT|nr:CCA tRNA nucleotidyltransferase [Geotalea uraniireducens]BDV42611.1 cytidine(C)-cytidine(C)-adenosine (A)]-adding enzyme [Geotalea uraniireducens]
MIFSELANRYPQLHLLAELAAGEGGAYLVGGCLRDLLLGRPVADLDLAGGPADLPRRFAARAGGSFFWLDEARGHGRVVIKAAGGAVTFDFAPLRGADLAADLRLRDFTINALAVPLVADGALVDPLGGEADLARRLVRACSPQSFADDPLRLVRAFRFAATLGFALEPATAAAIPLHAPLLARVAGERLRDELFAILAVPEPGPFLRAMGEAGLLAIPFGTPLPALAAATAAADAVDRAGCRLAAGDARFAARLQQQVQEGITVASLVKLAAFLSVAPPAGRAWQRLKLGTVAAALLTRLAGLDRQSCRAAVPAAGAGRFHFFSDREPAGPELALLAHARGELAEEPCRELIVYYFERYLPKGAPLLLTGDEVMALLGIPPGPLVGEALELLRQAQSLGTVATAATARAWLRKKLLTTDEPIG